MQLKDVTSIIKEILEERDKNPLIINTERYIPCYQPNKYGNAVRAGLRKALRIIEQAPVVDAVPVRRGKWGAAEIVGYDGLHVVYAAPCSACGAYTKEYKPKFCPHCGAKMDLEG